MGGEVQIESRGEALCELSLIVVLLIVVGIVAVASLGLGATGVHVSRGVVGASVLGFFLAGDTIPSNTRALLPPEGEELHDGLVCEVPSLQEVGSTLGATTIDIAVGRGLAQPSLYSPVPTDTTCGGMDLTA